MAHKPSYEELEMRIQELEQEMLIRMREDEALRESENRYRSLVETSSDWLWEVDANGRYTYASSKVHEILGYAPEEVVGRTPFDLMPEEEARRVGAIFAEIATERRPFSLLENVNLHRDGRRVVLETSGVPVFGPDGEFMGYRGMDRDITERKRVEEALRNSENQLRAITDSARDAILMMDPEGMITYWNPAAERILGYTREEATGQNLHRLLSPQRYHAAHHAAFPGFVETGRGEATGKTLELVARRKDGEEIPVELSLSAFFMNGWHAVGLLRDITERKQAENTLRESEAKFRSYIESAPLAIFVADRRGQVVDSNPAATDLLGYAATTLRGMHILDLHLGKDREEVLRYFATLLEVGHIETESRMKRCDGKPIWVSLHTVMTSDQLSLGYCQDITERKMAERALRDSEKRFRVLAEASFEGIALTTEGGLLIDANAQLARMLGYDLSEIIGKPVLDMIFPEDRELVERNMKAGYEGLYENRLLRRDHSPLVVETRALQFNYHGRIVRVTVVRDITERKQLEEKERSAEAKLRQAQKLEAIGTLAGGIAHDFNNMLQPMMGYTEMALYALSPSNPLRHNLEQVLNASLRAKELVGQILTISRSAQEQQRIPIDISSIIKEALKFLRFSLPTSIEIRQNIQMGVALADATQIHQVLMNLCTNAAHAMDGKGILEVRLSPVDLSESDLADQSIVDLKPGPYLKLCVSDTGCGMDAKTMERIFDPYFTTKEVGKGSGLGLAVVHGIVKRHDGAVSVTKLARKGQYLHHLHSKNRNNGCNSCRDAL